MILIPPIFLWLHQKQQLPGNRFRKQENLSPNNVNPSFKKLHHWRRQNHLIFYRADIHANLCTIFITTSDPLNKTIPKFVSLTLRNISSQTF